MKTSGKSWAKYIDKSIKAKKSGYRTSASGVRYYEDRPNHSDVSRKDKYAKGGEVKLDADFYDKLQKAEMNWTKDNGKEYNRLMAIKNKAEEEKYSNKKMAKGGMMAKGGTPKDMEEELVYAHLKEIKRTKADVFNLGYSFGEGYIESKTSENKYGNNYLYSEITNGKVTHEWSSRYKKGGMMAKGGKTKKAKEPMIVRGYFEDEAIDYGKGGAIYKGDKVKIKDSNKTMVVTSIAKGKKGYVEFTGSEGTYLIGELEKFELGGMTSSWCYSIGGL
jgi:hypothetical protein